MSWSTEKMNEIYAKVQQAAVTDEEFREELLNNSSAAIAKIAGEELPDGFKVKVIENDPKYAATFVLPPMESEVLSDEDLDKVAGGACMVDQFTSNGVCAAFARCMSYSDNQACITK